MTTDDDRNPLGTTSTESQGEQQPLEQVVQTLRAALEVGDVPAAVLALKSLHPADQAYVVCEIPENKRSVVLGRLAAKDAARIVEEMRPDDVPHLPAWLEPDQLAAVLDLVSPDTAADVLRAMPTGEAPTVFAAMERSADVQPLLEYPDDAAGGRMTTKFVTVRADMTPAIALDALRLFSEEHGDVSEVFVLDGQGRLVGAVRVSRLALARPSQIVRDLMEDPPGSVPALTDQEECVRLVAHYGLSVLPVVNAEGVLLGVIHADELSDVATEEATEDMFRIAGIQGDRVVTSFRNSVATRLPWLTLNLGTTFVAAGIVGLFESTIDRLAILAVFLPVVAGQGGIGGTQALTLVVRGIALGEITGRHAKRMLAREALLGIVHGLFLAGLVGVAGYVWVGEPVLGLILAIAMLGNMLVAGVVGAGVPLALQAIQRDPAVSSAVVVTTVTDASGFLLFLGLAAIFIENIT